MENDTTFLITHMPVGGQDRLVCALFEGGRAAELSCLPPEKASILGNIYVGKVQNILTNINAAFVEIADGTLCYYSLEDGVRPLYVSQKRGAKLAPGDEILVQVCREAVKTKAPAVTCNLNFAGRYLALTTGKCGLGVSAKLGKEERARLRAIVEPLLAEAGEGRADGEALAGQAKPDFGVVVRTNAAEATQEELRAEFAELSALCRKTLREGRARRCFSLVYREPPAYAVRLRSLPRGELSRIVTDDEAICEELKNYLAEHRPEDLTKLDFYGQKAPSLASVYQLGREFTEALRPRVWLKSGGYLVIEPTEALTVVDVNTGKYTEKKKAADTYRKINLEAAREIARQLRLRNLSGIIVVDFIDMEDDADKTCLLDALAAELQKDPVRTALVDMTALGLVEITRKKVQKSLAEQAGA